MGWTVGCGVDGRGVGWTVGCRVDSRVWGGR